MNRFPKTAMGAGRAPDAFDFGHGGDRRASFRIGTGTAGCGVLFGGERVSVG